MKELIEAAEKYRRDTCNEACKQGFLGNNPSPSIKSAFIAGAEWMKKQMPMPEDSVAFQKGVKEGKRLAVETIKSRIDKILGDEQPAPILRMELQELIKKIEQ